MKKIVYGFLLGCLFSLFICVFLLSSEKLHWSSNEKDSIAFESTSANTKDNLDDQVAKSFNQLPHNDKDFKATNQLSSSVSSNKADSNLDVQLKAIAFVNSQSEEFRDFTHQNKGVDLSQQVKSLFEQEAVDATWANNFQIKLNDFFRQEKKLETYVPDSIVCKSKRCELSIPIMTSDDLAVIPSAVLAALPKNNFEIPPKVIFERDPISNHLNLFFIRDINSKFLE